MAKSIKFNLVLDGTPVRDIEGLQEHFNIDDVLEFYQTGLLQKWLKVRGYNEQLGKVEAITEKQTAIIELIKIFEIEKSDKEIKEAIYSLYFWEERKLEIHQWEKKNTSIKEIIADYHNGYDVLKERILENKEDISFMKSAAKEIFENYYEIFRIDFRYFFDKYKESSPLIIYAILMNDDLRGLLLEDQSIKATLDQMYVLKNLAMAKKLIYSKHEIYTKYNAPDYSELKCINEIDNKIKLHMFTGITDGYWKDLEVSKTKVMILSIPVGTFVRSVNNPKEELSAVDINGKFLIFDGLLYKSNDSSNPIVYMEV